VRRAPGAVVLTLALILGAALVPAALADDAGPTIASLGPGWSLEQGADGPVLVYTPERALPLRDARPEFRSGDTLLGYPLERAGRLELVMTPAALAALEAPSAWLSGRRLDGPTPVETIAGASTEPLPPARRVLRAGRDPGEPGPYATTTLSYALPDLAVPGYEAPLEVLAEVTAPVGAAGARPLVMFVHGRHDSCYSPSPGLLWEGGWPCPEGTAPVPSYQGYRYAAEVLASQGYLTVSIAVNAVNAQDGWMADNGTAARSALIRHHLDLWAEWNDNGGDPWGGRFQGAVDLDQVILVGHSRGGEGAERAALDADAAAGYRIAGLVLIAPTAAGRQVGAGVPTLVLLPYCDGDVSDLQGQQ
jgi:hypothetical protein